MQRENAVRREEAERAVARAAEAEAALEKECAERRAAENARMEAGKSAEAAIRRAEAAEGRALEMERRLRDEKDAAR